MIETWTLFHVSPRQYFDSVMGSGISPAFSRGRANVVWLVDESKLVWALAHVSAKDDISVLQLLVYTVKPPRAELRLARWPGVYQCLIAAYPTDVRYASDVLKMLENDLKDAKKTRKI